MDEKVIPMVEYFNNQGLKTFMSCEGHNKTNMSMFWISFDKTVTEEDLIHFMNNHSLESKYGKYFSSCDRFAQRIYTSPKGTIREWSYFAATPEAADQDLENWISCDSNI